MAFPILYQRNPKGEIKTFQVSVEDAKVITVRGLLEGEKKTTEKDYGNDTSLAEDKANQEFMRKVRAGYVDSLMALKEPAPDDNGEIVMKSKKLVDLNNTSKLFPIYVQPLYEGIRVKLLIKEALVICYDEDGIDISEQVEHILTGFRLMSSKVDIALDGVLFHPDMSKEDVLNTIEETPPPEYVRLAIVDVIDRNLTFEERKRIVESFVYSSFTTAAPNRECYDKRDLITACDGLRILGYKGVILRSHRSKYKPGVSNNLVESPLYQEDIFPIVASSTLADVNGEQPCLVCESDTGEEFKVEISAPLRGVAPEGKLDFWIGKLLHIRHFGLIDSIPLLPYGNSIREPESATAQSVNTQEAASSKQNKQNRSTQ